MKIYLVSGKARHDKDTSAEIIKQKHELRGDKPLILHLAYPIKTYARDFFGWDGQEETKPRELLNKLGTEIIREKLGKKDFYVNRIIEDIEILSNFYNIFIISDVRFPIEIENIKKRFPSAISINVFRPNFQSEELTKEMTKHITETALDTYDKYDYKINNITLKQLEEDLEEIVRKEEVNYEKDDK